MITIYFGSIQVRIQIFITKVNSKFQPYERISKRGIYKQKILKFKQRNTVLMHNPCEYPFLTILFLEHHNRHAYLIILLQNNFQMSQPSLQILRNLSASRKFQVPQSLENKDNKKVILSLKQQMNNIRQGMSKLLKVKSEENVLEKTLEIKNASIGYQKGIIPSNAELSKQRELQNKVKKLQEENTLLKARIKKLEEDNNKIIQQILNRKEELQKQNGCLEQKIKMLVQQLQSQNSLKKSKKPLLPMPKKSSLPISIQAQMNPECIMVPPIINHTLIMMQEQKKRMLKDIGIFQMKIKLLEDSQRRNNLALNLQNEDKIKSSLSRLNKKYQEKFLTCD